MKTAELVERRRQGWKELEQMCDLLQSVRFPFYQRGHLVVRFSALYRAACTDLSMADQYQLTPTTIEYLHRLVGRAHSQLYRTHRFASHSWSTYFWDIAPRVIFQDICVKIAFMIFFGLFTLSALVAWSEGTFPGYAERILGKEQIKGMEKSFSRPLEGNLEQYIGMSAFYIQHNTSIGLQCFALGPLILPSICTLAYNGVVLGASFGYMARPDVEEGDVFMQFVTAHGVFELTAIALSAAAGLRLGLGLFLTHGLRRMDSFLLNAHRALPIILASVVLFIMAAFTEGFLSPSPAPYVMKAGFAVFSSALLMYYFVIRGYPKNDSEMMFLNQ